MSTKTSFKRIALVAASALAIAGFSAVPAHAADVTTWDQTIAASKVTAITLKGASTNTNVTSTAVKVNFGAALTTTTVTAGDHGQTAAFKAYLSSYPAGGFAQVSAVAAVGTATPLTGATTDITTTPTLTVKQTVQGTAISGSTTASSSVGIAAFQFTPTVAGTYVLTAWHDPAGAGTVDIGEAVQTISITVTAASGLAASATIVSMSGSAEVVTAQNATSDAAFTTTKDAVARTAARGATAATRNNIAAIEVILLNSNATAAGNLHTVSASVTGSGLVSIDAGAAEAAGTARAASYTLTGTDNIAIVHVTTDGTVGTGTVTISVTDSVTGATTVVGTRTVTTYGSTAKLAVGTTNFNIGRAGYKTGGNSTTRIKATEIGTSTNTSTVTDGTTTTPAFIVKATDSAGAAVVTAADPTIVSSDATVVSGGACARDAGSADYGSSTNGVGYYNCSFTTVASAKSGSKATLTIRVLDPADPLGVAYLTTTYAVTVGGSVAKEVLSTDAATYSTGAAMIISIKATDASGNPVFDGAASPAVTASKALGGSSLAAGIYVGGLSATSASVATATAFAPATSGDFSLTATGTDAAATALSATASVEGDSASSLALDAANAATDAANNAYDEAQNATQAASDALAAVTALAAQVKSLIASVKKLTAAVAKLKK